MEDDKPGSLYLTVKYSVLFWRSDYHHEVQEITVMMSRHQAKLSFQSFLTGITNILTTNNYKYGLGIEPLIETSSYDRDDLVFHKVCGFLL